MSSPANDTILQEMIRERDEFLEFSRLQIQEMDDQIRRRKERSDKFKFQMALNEVEPTQDEQARVSPEFQGLSYPSVVHKILSLQSERTALTVSGIAEAMALHGVVPVAKDPRSTVQTALNRRRRTHGDIVHIGLGEWGLKEWYTKSDLKRFDMAQTGANSRDTAEHRKAMIKGIKESQARGAYYGKPPKITEEMWNLIIRLYVDEGQPMAHVHRKVSELFPEGETPITQTALYNRRKQFMAREPYPKSWRAYFQSRDAHEDAKKKVEEGRVTELSLFQKDMQS